MPTTDYIVVPGKVDIYIACPMAYSLDPSGTPVAISAGTPYKLGESADEIRIRHTILKNPVPGDRNGGRSGDPIEKQYLGETASVQLELSRFNTDVANQLLRAGGLLTNPGVIPDTAIGGLLLRDRTYRFTFVATVDSSRTRNFYCGEVESAHILSGGTKFEMFQAEISFHRAPPGHWTGTDGSTDNILFDADTTGIA